MRHLAWLIFAITLAPVSSTRAATPDKPLESSAAVRDAVTRSLPYLERKGVAWIAERGCVSCHQTNFLIWTHSEARRRGFAVDPTKLNGWTAWALLNALVAQQNGTRQGADTLTQLLLGRDEQSWLVVKPTLSTRTNEPYENVVKDLLADQSPDGSWTAGGQSKNPPDAPTGWAVFALMSRDHATPGTTRPATKPSNDDDAPHLQELMTANVAASTKARERAREWLRNVKEDPAKDLTEQLVVRLLADAWTPGNEQRFAQRKTDLLARQNADGGWSVDPKRSQPSDAFATGMVLYALARAKAGDDATRVARAQSFLCTTQQADGAWRVPTTAFHPLTGRPRDARTDDVYTYWGTAWATLGLLYSLPVSAGHE